MTLVYPLRAMRFDARTIACGLLYIVGDDPVGLLCQELVRAGEADRVLVVVGPDLSLQFSLASVHQAARAAADRGALRARDVPASGAGPPAAPD